MWNNLNKSLLVYLNGYICSGHEENVLEILACLVLNCFTVYNTFILFYMDMIQFDTITWIILCFNCKSLWTTVPTFRNEWACMWKRDIIAADVICICQVIRVAESDYPEIRMLFNFSMWERKT